MLSKRKKDSDDEEEKASISNTKRINYVESTSNYATPLFGPTCPNLTREYMFNLVQEGNIGLFKALAPRFIIEADRDANQDTFLHRLVTKCKNDGFDSIENTLKLILRESLTLTCQKNKLCETPLLLACRRRNFAKLITTLADASPHSTKIVDGSKTSALIHFLSNVRVGTDTDNEELTLEECFEVIKTLIKHGQNINEENYDKKTALCYLLERYDLEPEIMNKFARILFQNGAKLISPESRTHAFRFLNKLSYELILIIHEICPADLMKGDFNDWNILNHILNNRQLCRVNNGYIYLLKCHNLDLMAFDSPQLLQTLQFIFRDKETLEIGSELIAITALRNASIEVIKFILSKTVNFKITPNNENCLILAQFATCVENVDLVYSLGAKVNKVLNNGKHALCVAAEAKSKETIVRLLEIGAQPLNLVTQYEKLNNHEEFIAFITDDACLDLLITILRCPQVKDVNKKQASSKFYNVLLRIICENNTNQEMTILKLQLVREHTNEGTEIWSEMDVSALGKIIVEPIGYFLGNKNSKGLFEIDPQALDDVYKFIDLLLDAGFNVSNLPENCVTPLTVLLDVLEHHRIKFHPDVLKIMNLLIEKGKVNVHSIALASCGSYLKDSDNQLKFFARELMIPDVLAIAITKSYSKTVIRKLMSYWWAPPIVLVSILVLGRNPLDTAKGRNRIKVIYPLLLEYGGLPYGTSLLCKTVWREMNAWMVAMKELQKTDTTIEVPDIEKVSPASLVELSKYALRHSLAKKALQEGTSLPTMLQGLLPPLLVPVAIH